MRLNAEASVPRERDPEFAERIATNISAESAEALERIAREECTTPAQVLRWAVRDYLANRAADRQDDVRVVAAS